MIIWIKCMLFLDHLTYNFYLITYILHLIFLFTYFLIILPVSPPCIICMGDYNYSNYKQKNNKRKWNSPNKQIVGTIKKLKTHPIACIANLHPNLHTLFFAHSEYLKVEVTLASIYLSIGYFGTHSNNYPNKIHKNMC